MNVEYYLNLVAKAIKTMADEDIDAIEAYEAKYPEIADATYQAGGPYEYDILNGVVL
jgi:hypothetical protein